MSDSRGDSTPVPTRSPATARTLAAEPERIRRRHGRPPAEPAVPPSWPAPCCRASKAPGRRDGARPGRHRLRPTSPLPRTVPIAASPPAPKSPPWGRAGPRRLDVWPGAANVEARTAPRWLSAASTYFAARAVTWLVTPTWSRARDGAAASWGRPAVDEKAVHVSSTRKTGRAGRDGGLDATAGSAAPCCSCWSDRGASARSSGRAHRRAGLARRRDTRQPAHGRAGLPVSAGQAADDLLARRRRPGFLVAAVAGDPLVVVAPSRPGRRRTAVAMTAFMERPARDGSTVLVAGWPGLPPA